MKYFNPNEARELFQSMGWSDSQVEESVQFYSRVYKYRKTGENVLHLSVEGELLSDEEINSLENDVASFGFEFSYQNETIVPKAFVPLEDPSLAYFTLPDLIANSIVYPSITAILGILIRKIYQRFAQSDQKPLPKITLRIRNQKGKRKKFREITIKRKMSDRQLSNILNRFLTNRKK